MPNTLDPPLSVIESWPTPNYIDPPTRGSALLVFSIVLCVLGLLTILCRLYIRLKITRAFGSDDVLAVSAYAWALALTVLVIIGNLRYGDGRHIWDVPPASFAPHRLNVWWGELAYVISSCCVRISVQLFYRRLSVSFTRLFMWATWIGIAYNVLYMAGFILWLLLLCRPLDAYWKKYDFTWAATHEYQCAAENIALPLSAAMSVLGDLYATVVPLLLITSMSKTFKEKAALYCLFSLGFLVVAAGLVRTVLDYRMMNIDYDFTWILFDCWLWTEIELYFAILAASAPALRPFFQIIIVDNFSASWATSRTVVSSAATRMKRKNTKVANSGADSDSVQQLSDLSASVSEGSQRMKCKHEILIEDQLRYWSTRDSGHRLDLERQSVTSCNGQSWFNDSQVHDDSNSIYELDGSYYGPSKTWS